MPKKKVEKSLGSERNDDKTKLEQLIKETKNDESHGSGIRPNSVDIEKKAEELSNGILRVLYKTYGVKDSHTNKHLYQPVIFEVAILSNKTIEEVTQKWPKFDIFSIAEDIRKVVREELENDKTIMYRMITNGRMTADRILAKLIYKNIMR